MDNVDKRTQRGCSIIVVGVSLFCILIGYSAGMSGNDYWWHIKVGEWICNNKQIPVVDIFSWYGVEEGAAWVAHEWLAEVILYKIQSFFGNNGMYLFCMVLAITMVGFLLYYVKRYWMNNILITASYFISFSVLCNSFFYGRPHVFSFLLLFLVMYCIYTYIEHPEAKCIYAIPFLTWLWSNLHGGSSNLPYLLCMVALVCGQFEFSYFRIQSKRLSKKQSKTFLVIIITSILLSILNPSGINLLIYPYSNMADALMLSIISEWAAPDAKQISHLVLYYFPIFIITVSMVITDKKLKLLDVIMMFFFLVLFLRSIRFTILYLIAAPFFAYPYVVPCKVKSIKNKWERRVLLLAYLLIAIANVVVVRDVLDTIRSDKAITVVLEEDMIQLVKEDKPVRIFNDYNFGEALIYEDIPVFIDSRADVYSNNILSDAISLLYLINVEGDKTSEAIDAESMIEKYGFDAVLIEKNRPLTSYLQSHPQKYQLVDIIGDAAYFRVREKEGGQENEN